MHYLVVGSGLFGAVFASEMAQEGHKVTVLEKRNHIAGNIYTKEICEIQTHQYGAHIFHTSSKKIWEYINQFAEFNQFVNSPISISKGKIYNLPFNMNTFNQIWGVMTPKEAEKKIMEQRKSYNERISKNLEEQALSLVGKDVYELLIKEYTEKQWGKPCSELPSFIIKRLPVRFNFDNNYFNDIYQGIPIGGYTKIIKKMLTHPNINVLLETDFLKNRDRWENEYKKIIYTGMIDEYYNYCYGELSYRTLKFEHEILDIDNYQGNAVVNYNDIDIPYTRIIEHKHFEFGKQKKTVITREYPKPFKKGDEPYYPVNDQKNNLLYKKYRKLADKSDKVVFGGRLGMYRYYDMHQVIEAAFNLSEKERILNKNVINNN